MEKIIDSIIELCRAFRTENLPAPKSITATRGAVDFIKANFRNPKYQVVSIVRGKNGEPIPEIFGVQILEAEVSHES